MDLEMVVQVVDLLVDIQQMILEMVVRALKNLVVKEDVHLSVKIGYGKDRKI